MTDERARLAARLEHRLQSSLLLLREAVTREDQAGAEAQLNEVSARARGLAASVASGPRARQALEEILWDWMGPAARWYENDGLLTVEAPADREPPEVEELGEPLVRLLAAEAGGELVSWEPRRAVLRLPG